MSGEILRLKPDEVARLFAEGKMAVINTTTSAPLETPHITDDLMIERAKEVLGKDFLGVEAVRNMENKLKGIGVNVEFALDKLSPFPYTEEDLQTAKVFGEMLVLRTETMLRKGREVPLTLIGFRELFQKDPLRKLRTVAVFDTDWYKGEKFATEAGEIKLGWSLVKKDVLDGSNTGWNNQEPLLQQHKAELRGKGARNYSIKRRTAIEAVYDTLLYYVNNEERLLPDKYDTVQSRSSRGRNLYVGCFGALNYYGLRVDDGSTEHSVLCCDPRSTSYTGVCPTR